MLDLINIGILGFHMEKCFSLLMHIWPLSRGGHLLAGARTLTVRERILLHLFDNGRFAGDYEAPTEVTQTGIAKAVGIRVRHVAQYVNPAVSKDLIEVRKSRVKRQRQRRKVYFLTPVGRKEAASLRQNLFSERVPFKARDGTIRNIAFSKAYQEVRRGSSILELLEEVRSLGFITEIKRKETGEVVDFSHEAPSVDLFYGRDSDLQKVVQLLERYPLVVVIGIAGIGKSTLGSKIRDLFVGERSLFWHRVRPWDTTRDLALSVGGFLKALGKMELYVYLTGSGTKETRRVEEIMLRDLAETSSVLILDDLHVVSEKAQAFLSILHEALKGQSDTTALLLSRTTPRFYSRQDVDVEGSVAEFSLGGLDKESSVSLLTDAGFPRSQSERLALICGGSPLFLRIMAKAGPRRALATGVPKLEDYICEEIEPWLDDDERDCIEVASLYEVPVSARGLLVNERGGTRTLVGLQKKGLLLRLASGRFVVHDTVRGYFREGLSSERRSILADRVVPALLHEVGEAAKANRLQEAIACLENALMIETRPLRKLTLLEQLGELREETQDLPGALDTYRVAMKEASEPGTRARLHWRTASVLEYMENLEAAEVEIEKGLELLPPGPSLDVGRLHLVQVRVMNRRNLFPSAFRIIQRLTQWMPSLPQDPGFKSELARLRGWIRLFEPSLRDPAEAKADFAESIEALESSAYWNSIPYRGFALAAIEMGQVEEGLSLIDRSIEIAKSQAATWANALLLFLKAWCYSECLGEHDRGEELYHAAYDLQRQSAHTFKIPWFHRHLTELYMRQSRREEAMETMEHFLTEEEESLSVAGALENYAFMVRLCLDCSDDQLARIYLNKADALLNLDPTATATFFTEWARGLLRASQGHDDEAEDSFQRALRVTSLADRDYDGMLYLPSGGFQGQLLLDYGRFLVSAGDALRAKEILLRAHAESVEHHRKPLEQAVEVAMTALEVAVRHS